jgi:hypothetical protein
LRVTGRSSLEIENPLPASVSALTITAAVPDEVKVSDCVVAVFTFTLPKARLEVLRLRAGTEAPNCKGKVCATPPRLAVIVEACTVVTGEILAVKSALLAPAGTVTEAGTTTALLLLARFTPRPPLAAAAFSVTVQLSEPAPVIELLVQVSWLSIGTPVPLRLTAVDVPVEELVVIVNWPVTVPDAVGLNWMGSVTLPLAATVIGKLLWPLTEKNWPVIFN